MTIKKQVGDIFGAYLDEETSYEAFLDRMDQAGKIDQKKLLQMVILVLKKLEE